MGEDWVCVQEFGCQIDVDNLLYQFGGVLKVFDFGLVVYLELMDVSMLLQMVSMFMGYFVYMVIELLLLGCGGLDIGFVSGFGLDLDLDLDVFMMLG